MIARRKSLLADLSRRLPTQLVSVRPALSRGPLDGGLGSYSWLAFCSVRYGCGWRQQRQQIIPVARVCARARWSHAKPDALALAAGSPNAVPNASLSGARQLGKNSSNWRWPIDPRGARAHCWQKFRKQCARSVNLAQVRACHSRAEAAARPFERLWLKISFLT